MCSVHFRRCCQYVVRIKITRLKEATDSLFQCFQLFPLFFKFKHVKYLTHTAIISAPQYGTKMIYSDVQGLFSLDLRPVGSMISGKFSLSHYLITSTWIMCLSREGCNYLNARVGGNANQSFLIFLHLQLKMITLKTFLTQLVVAGCFDV